MPCGCVCVCVCVRGRRQKGWRTSLGAGCRSACCRSTFADSSKCKTNKHAHTHPAGIVYINMRLENAVACPHDCTRQPTRSHILDLHKHAPQSRTHNIIHSYFKSMEIRRHAEIATHTPFRSFVVSAHKIHFFPQHSRNNRPTCHPKPSPENRTRYSNRMRNCAIADYSPNRNRAAFKSGNAHMFVTPLRAVGWLQRGANNLRSLSKFMRSRAQRKPGRPNRSINPKSAVAAAV